MDISKKKKLFVPKIIIRKLIIDYYYPTVAKYAYLQKVCEKLSYYLSLCFDFVCPFSGKSTLKPTSKLNNFCLFYKKILLSLLCKEFFLKPWYHLFYTKMFKKCLVLINSIKSS